MPPTGRDIAAMGLPLARAVANSSHVIRTPLLIDGDGVRRGDFAVVVRGGPRGAVIAGLGDAASDSMAADRLPVVEAKALGLRPVNAHTHLDLTDYPPMEGEFPDFVARVAEHRRLHPGARGVAAASRGMAELLRQGVSAVGDVVARESVMQAELQNSPLPGVSYWEVICTDQAMSRASIDWLGERLRAWRRLQRPGGPVVGLAPQSAYLVSKDVLRFVARLAVAEGLPLQIHLAESAAEVEFFRSGAGPLATTLARCGFRHPPTARGLGWDPQVSLTPIRYLAEIGVLDAAPTLVHCVNVSDDDVRIIAEHRCPVVTCPRSNRHLRCGVFPWKKFVRAGVAVALATDSLASAHDLDLGAELSECLSLHGPELEWAMALQWLTVGASAAIGRTAPRLQIGLPVELLAIYGLGGPPR